MKLTIPNILTLGRVVGIPVIFILFCLPYDWARHASGVVYAVVAITDWFDGYLARRLNQSSKFGAFLDPVADKLLVAVSLVLIVMDNAVGQASLLVTLCAAVIIGREIVISALREWLAELGERATVAVSSIGKIKTGFQMTALGLLLWRDDIFILPTYIIGMTLLVLAAILTLYSMVLYLRAAWPVMKD